MNRNSRLTRLLSVVLGCVMTLSLTGTALAVSTDAQESEVIAEDFFEDAESEADDSAVSGGVDAGTSGTIEETTGEESADASEQNSAVSSAADSGDSSTEKGRVLARHVIDHGENDAICEDEEPTEDSGALTRSEGMFQRISGFFAALFGL